MDTDGRVALRVQQLIADAPRLEKTNSDNRATHPHECIGWITAAWHVVQLACPTEPSPYRTMAAELAGRNKSAIHLANTVGAMRHILERLLDDLNDGLLASVVDHARAEIFDDFLESAKEYQRRGRKNEAGAIAGVVFEDTLRRLCDKHQVAQAGQALDQLISELTARNVITGTKSKRARSAAHVRTKATHAQWDEFDTSDVEATIGFTAELIQLLDA